MAEEEDAFTILYEEYEAFKQTYTEMESALNKQLDELRAENKVLKRQVGEEQKQKESYRQRLADSTSGDEDLRRTIAGLEEQVTAMKKARSAMQNELETLERLNRQHEFTLAKLTAERDEAADALIISKEEQADLQEQLAAAKGDALHLRVELTESKSQPPRPATPPPPMAAHGSTGGEASLGEALETIAARLRSIAAKCRSRE